MKKVLIISYFFPPCNLTASQRAYGWAKYLKKYGYNPIVVTRSWENKITSPEDVLTKSGTELVRAKNEQFEVYRVPYKPVNRDRFYTKYQGSKLQQLSKLATVWNLVWENFTINVIPHKNMYDLALKLIGEERIDKMIITGNPFDQFHFGYLLNKKTNIKWIADYRDDWTTSELNTSRSFVMKAISLFHKRSEKKWVNSASMITSISPHYTKKISDLVGVKGETILNGYELPDTNLRIKPDREKFTITYNGSLYPSQPIEAFLDAVKELICEKNLDLPIFINFPGLAFDKDQESRVQKYLKGFEGNYRITKRISRKEVLKIQLESDLLLMISHSKLKGIPSSKLYEYIGLEKPILLFPNDTDILEETLSNTGLGIICDTKEKIKTSLIKLIKRKTDCAALIKSINSEAIQELSRENQTRHLAELLDQI